MLTVERQCELLGIPRSTCYYKPKPKDSAVDEAREAAMRAIDDIHLEMPFVHSPYHSVDLIMKKPSASLSSCALLRRDSIPKGL